MADFSPRVLPPPGVDGTVVEYVNLLDFPGSPGGRYFYSADTSEQKLIEEGKFGHWQRTGKAFLAGGYLPVCRFYGSLGAGPNSHFFTVDPAECNGLKSRQSVPTPADKPQWNFEGKAFYMTYAQGTEGERACPAGTRAVYRAYNGAFDANGKKNTWDSNHRFSLDRADIDSMVTNYGWTDEGIRMCALW